MATEQQIEAAVATVAQRNEKGQWLRGHQGGPGMPKRSTVAEYWDITMLKCPLDKWGQIVEMAVADALGPSPQARRYGREWLGRMFIPAVERILVTSLSVNVNTEDTLANVRRLVQMLSIGSEDSDVIEGDITDVKDK
jgi:hypothetical protein